MATDQKASAWEHLRLPRAPSKPGWYLFVNPNTKRLIEVMRGDDGRLYVWSEWGLLELSLLQGNFFGPLNLPEA